MQSIKILKHSDIGVLCKSLKSRGLKIVFTNGCFDILHVGHVAYLQQAKAQGDVLIVAVNADSSVSEQKGSARPINCLQNRLHVLSALSCVDYLICFDTKTPEHLLELIQPNILVKGGDYKNINEVVGKDYVESYGGKVYLLGQVTGASTTLLIERIRSIYGDK